MTALDRRLHAFRPDLAEETLRGKVEAKRFVRGEPARIAVPVADLRPRPERATGIDTQALLGEDVLVFESQNGWSWVKLLDDRYVGYLRSDTLAPKGPSPTHRIAVPRSFLYPEPDLKRPPVGCLSMGARLRVAGDAEVRGTRYALLETGEAVVASHLWEIDRSLPGDHVDVAARFIETPYLWGGRSGFGIDCSGLIQLALAMTGVPAPRDSDMQAEGLGVPIASEEAQRGDLIFWNGHVAILETPESVIHANGQTMSVARETLGQAIERIAPVYGQPTLFRRPPRAAA